MKRAQSTEIVETDRRGEEMVALLREEVKKGIRPEPVPHFLHPIAPPTRDERRVREVRIEDRITHGARCLGHDLRAREGYIASCRDGEDWRLERHVWTGGACWFLALPEGTAFPEDRYVAVDLIPPEPRKVKPAAGATKAGRGRPAGFTCWDMPVTGVIRWLGAEGANAQETTSALEALFESGDLTPSLPKTSTIQINLRMGRRHARSGDAERPPADLAPDQVTALRALLRG